MKSTVILEGNENSNNGVENISDRNADNNSSNKINEIQYIFKNHSGYNKNLNSAASCSWFYFETFN